VQLPLSLHNRLAPYASLPEGLRAGGAHPPRFLLAKTLLVRPLPGDGPLPGLPWDVDLLPLSLDAVVGLLLQRGVLRPHLSVLALLCPHPDHPDQLLPPLDPHPVRLEVPLALLEVPLVLLEVPLALLEVHLVLPVVLVE